MLKEINTHLLNHVDLHDDMMYKLGLFDNWYEKNYINLMSAIQEAKGIKLILDVDTFQNLEKYCKKLFLFTDILIIRDSIKRTKDESEMVLMPISEKCWLDKKHIDIESLPPIAIRPPEGSGYWVSDEVVLKNGEKTHIAAKFNSFFSRQVYNWVLTKGKKYIETGEIAYAPFIPSADIELEFFKRGYDIPGSYNLQTLYCNNYDWLDKKSLNSILSLQLPTLENIDIPILNQIKQDNYDNYKLFRNDLISSINDIKSNFGSNDFLKELKYIQKNRIDDNIDKINIEMKKLNKMRTLRKLGIFLGAIGLDFSLLSPISSMSVGVIGLAIEEAIARLQEKGLIQENPYYFLWKIKAEIGK